MKLVQVRWLTMENLILLLIKVFPMPFRLLSAKSLACVQFLSFQSNLGMPLLFGRNRTEARQHLIDKMSNQINNWFCTQLSMGGKDVLMSTILLAMPQYVMSCHILPDAIIIKHIHGWRSSGVSIKGHIEYDFSKIPKYVNLLEHSPNRTLHGSKADSG